MGPHVADLTISTEDYEADGRMPDRLAKEGGNEAPRFVVAGVPKDAVELALVVHDPDAPMARGFTHWVVYGLPAIDGAIDPSLGRAAPTSAGEPGWYGPQPPVGHGTHRYYAWVYALSEPIGGEPTREAFLDRHAGAILEQNRVVGTYSR
ncbi:YbhB/YbcL family Raf kinase inhibitor-like protein [Agrococcus jejuensis]|uniref:Phospholipid-binding protein, PBP family n=1 Tax=Agrococcus jejuensis TaxID=399736 RepID=A0A1G8DX33_9MICO|nr:YbhB/YbcL family Raf kinase inhibitor-like protein [Agrococcus jejuensis]SDH62306.1 phospholipid-binding protein, PBP family [Agrococcus jejuensis]